VTIRFDEFRLLVGTSFGDFRTFTYVSGLDERILWVVEKAKFKYPPNQIFKGVLLIRFLESSRMPSDCRIEYVLNGEPLRKYTARYVDTITELCREVPLMVLKWPLITANI